MRGSPVKLDLYKFSDGAKEDLLSLDLGLSYADILAKVRAGAKINHTSGNLCHGNLVFRLKNKLVIGITLVHLKQYARRHNFFCRICHDSKQVHVGDPCEICNAKGCESCKDGLVYKKITCPNCTETGTRFRDERNDSNTIERQQSHGNGRPVPGRTRRRS